MLRAQEVVKAVLVDALAGHGAAEAAEAAAAEGELPQIHHTALIGQCGAEIGYHVRQGSRRPAAQFVTMTTSFAPLFAASGRVGR